ncbi:hypothetical protein LTR85_003986 [Meristemomyces frigidus]|nr:hypothetical protein LTR85_003986 [Meristemomyces frigidus]
MQPTASSSTTGQQAAAQETSAAPATNGSIAGRIITPALAKNGNATPTPTPGPVNLHAFQFTDAEILKIVTLDIYGLKTILDTWLSAGPHRSRWPQALRAWKMVEAEKCRAEYDENPGDKAAEERLHETQRYAMTKMETLALRESLEHRAELFGPDGSYISTQMPASELVFVPQG